MASSWETLFSGPQLPLAGFSSAPSSGCLGGKMSENLINLLALVANIAPFTFADSKQMKVRRGDFRNLFLFLVVSWVRARAAFSLRCGK